MSYGFATDFDSVQIDHGSEENFAMSPPSLQGCLARQHTIKQKCLMLIISQSNSLELAAMNF